MGNPRSFTTNHNATNAKLEAFVKAQAGRSMTKRREAVARAVTMPNRLPPIARSGGIPGGTRASLTKAQEEKGER